MLDLPSIPLWLLAVDLTIRLGVAAMIIYRRRPVNVSLMWLVVLAFIPFLGAALYFLIGESRLGSHRLRRYLELSKDLDIRAGTLWKHEHTDVVEEGAEPELWAPVARFGTAVSGLPPLKGNKLTLIGDAHKMIESLILDIDNAKSHVHLLYYIWQKDNPGPVIELIDALLRAAARGVECRVLVDAVGAKHFLRGKHVRRLREGGVTVVVALPVGIFRMLFDRIDLRNHRKIAIIDGTVAYCGSHNMTDSSFRVGWIWKSGEYFDATIRIAGPAAGALAVVFLHDWLLDAEEKLDNLEKYIPNMRAKRGHSSAVQIIPSGPGPAPDAIHQALLTTIYLAREELLMTTPYFIPDEALSKALQSAARRGVSVTLVMPADGDSWLVEAASRAHYSDLLEAGVKILHYRGGLLHAKTITVDRKFGLIGSTNFDARSFWLNFEVTVLIYDDDFASEMRFMQMSYVADSYEIFADEWRKRPLWQIFRDNGAQLLGPLL
jgi:cardiolipin synthase